MILLLFVLFLLLDRLAPLPLQAQDSSRVVVDRQGIPLRTFANRAGVWRYPISLEQVAPAYLDALIQYEDRYFWQHPGVNPVAILRALYLNLSQRKIISGGSTLTMQVARLLEPHRKTIWGKCRQAFRALQLEWHLSKRDILTLYINHAPFGGTLEGIQAASYSYLNKPASDLTDAEAALMAVLPQAPSYYRPDRYPQRAQQARDKVLQRLQHFQAWSTDRVNRARQEQVSAYEPQRPLLAPLLAMRLQQQQASPYIHTTLDAHLQQQLQDFLHSALQQLPDHTTAAALIVDNQHSDVLAYVGNAAYGDADRFGYIDMIQATRSPGSTLKPFLYGLTLDEGLVHAQSLLSDVPLHYGDYRPQNFDRAFSGPVSFSKALQHSLNVTAVQLLQQYGPNRFYAKLENAGVDLSLPSGKPNLAMILGGVGSNLWHLIQGYTAFSHQGKSLQLRVLTQQPQQQRPLLSAGSAWVIYDILRQQLRPDHIASNSVQHDKTLGWKTGTSYGHRDAWAIGISPQYTLGVWVGRPDGTPLPGHYGAITAAPLLTAIYDALPKQDYYDIAQPDSVIETEICWPLGTEATTETAPFCEQRHQAWIVDGKIPPTLPDPGSPSYQSNPLHYWINPESGDSVTVDCQLPMQPRSAALWPLALEPWLNPSQRRQQRIPPVDQRCPNAGPKHFEPLKILGLRDGNQYQSMPGTQIAPQIQLSAMGGSGTRHWYINGRYLADTVETNSHPYALTKSGQYQIMVSDDFGQTDMLEIELRPAVY